ncbi:unnamed protein product [Rhizophagus irregularis]|nr:unnamed protein product [Rhizophagus irregularis]
MLSLDFQLSLEGEYAVSEVWVDFWLSLEVEYADFRLSLKVCGLKMLAVTVILRHSIVCNRLQPIYIKKQKL